jgi:hypothetical protein
VVQSKKRAFAQRGIIEGITRSRENFFRGCGRGSDPAMVTRSTTSKEDAMDSWWHDIDRDVNVVLERHGSMTPAEIARMLRLSEGAVSSVLSMLAQEGKLRIARVELPPRDDGRQLSL